jgi:hypothetical protein
MKAMHAICHFTNGEFNNLRKIDIRKGLYASGWWCLSEDQAKDMAGGWIYLHDSSNKMAEFVGKISADGLIHKDGNYELIFVKQPQIKNQRWRGEKPGQSPSQNFRIVEADEDHEV